MAKPKKTKVLCQGCRDNYYNQPGNSLLNEERGCWCYDRAQVCKRKAVHMDQVPPWNQPAHWTLDCYHESGYIYVAPEVTR